MSSSAVSARTSLHVVHLSVRKVAARDRRGDRCRGSLAPDGHLYRLRGHRLQTTRVAYRGQSGGRCANRGGWDHGKRHSQASRRDSNPPGCSTQRRRGAQAPREFIAQTRAHPDRRPSSASKGQSRARFSTVTEGASSDGEAEGEASRRTQSVGVRSEGK